MLEDEPKPKQLGLGLKAKPKRSTGEPLPAWLYAERKGGYYPEHSEYGGKWLIYVYWADLTGLCAVIQEAVEAGQLGQYAKVSNRLGKPGSGDSRAGVICVYT